MLMLENIEPKEVWKYFEEICKIPRCSKNEERIANYIMEVARNYGYEVSRDRVGNVVARKGEAKITFQCHMDMVCEKNKDVVHDFLKDGIKPYIDGDYVRARGTTLGADNGIGIAISLALMEKNLPIEFLFTVDEESGLTGAFALEKGFIKGKYLINLDSEDFGVIYIGCAGGGNSTISMKVRYLNKRGEGVRIVVKGLKGGHSGIEIDKGRANSIKLLARILYELDGRIGKIEGGDKHNAIPREAFAEIITEKSIEEIKKKAEEMKNIFTGEYPQEKSIEIVVEKCEMSRVLDKRASRKILNLLLALPHGIISMSQDVKGLVETSTNLATVRMEEELKIVISSRSSIDSALDGVMQSIRCIAQLAGAKVEEGSKYPGWKPNLESKLLKMASEAFYELYGKEPEKKAIHAGLETGIIGKITGINEIISIGPQIEHPHSPDEFVQISSVEKFWKYVLHLIEKIHKIG
ncbi:MAG: aminoacyl-histidine dipeptidase [Thermoplasmatales archaeon]|nr:aminoacyl-histidine dipeptidase [Thermoplasmatales archaeon]